MTRKHPQKFFVGDAGYPCPGSALSAAQGLASRWPDDEIRSFYVRDALDNAIYRVDKEQGGVVLTFTI